MSLELDTRQRAMLQEMGIAVWQPVVDDVNVVDDISVVDNTIKIIANNAINTSARAINLAENTVNAVSPRVLPPKASASVAASVSVAASAPVVANVQLQPMPAGLQEMDWPSLQQTAQSCQACQLCAGRKNTVFGTPSAAAQADWLIVGDPPTESDESAGAPFTADEGVLLGNMLKAMGLSVQQVTLTPSVKCRSEGLSTGAPELAQCEAYLRRQVALTQPKMILAMGRYAAQALLANTVSNPVPPLGQLRGVVHQYQADGKSFPVVVTYSPANLLRSPAEKAKAWADLCLAKASF
jgi:uracil-DNA glycosylase